jgi:hypothetical protein
MRNMREGFRDYLDREGVHGEFLLTRPRVVGRARGSAFASGNGGGPLAPILREGQELACAVQRRRFPSG